MYQFQIIVETVLFLLAWNACDGAGCLLACPLKFSWRESIASARLLSRVYRQDHLILAEEALGVWAVLTDTVLQKISAMKHLYSSLAYRPK